MIILQAVIALTSTQTELRSDSKSCGFYLLCLASRWSLQAVSCCAALIHTLARFLLLNTVFRSDAGSPSLFGGCTLMTTHSSRCSVCVFGSVQHARWHWNHLIASWKINELMMMLKVTPAWKQSKLDWLSEFVSFTSSYTSMHSVYIHMHYCKVKPPSIKKQWIVSVVFLFYPCVSALF